MSKDVNNKNTKTQPGKATAGLEADFYKSINHFEAIVNASDDSIISKTLGDIVKSWNPAAYWL